MFKNFLQKWQKAMALGFKIKKKKKYKSNLGGLYYVGVKHKI